MVGLDQIGNAPVAARRDVRHGRVAIEAEERHGGAEDARPLILRLVQHLARGGCYYRVNLRSVLRTEMIGRHHPARSEEHTSELKTLMRTSYAVFCLKKKKKS